MFVLLVFTLSFQIKISNLEVFSVTTLNQGDYICNATNHAGFDEFTYRVHIIPYYSGNSGSSNQIVPAASSSDSHSVFTIGKSKLNESEWNWFFG